MPRGSTDSYDLHFEEFGLCQCSDAIRTGVQFLRLEVFEGGIHRVEDVPACADCFGLI